VQGRRRRPIEHLRRERKRTIMDFSQFILPAIYVLILILAGLCVAIFLSGKGLKGRLIRALNMKLFLITIPRDLPKAGEQPQKTEKEMIAIAEQFLSNLSQIKPKSWWKKFYYGPPHIVFEIAVPHVGEELSLIHI